MEPRHSHTGMLLSEWIDRVPNELSFDAVGLWQVVPTLRHDFGLQGLALENAVRQTVDALMRKGAIPVYCGAQGETEWVASEVSGQSTKDVADFIVSKWVHGSDEPTVGDLWFAIPQ